METTKDRLKRFATVACGLSMRAFERECGMAPNYICSANKTINSAAVELIAARYPDLNLNWLFTGKGGMLNSEGVLSRLEALEKKLNT